MPHSPYAFGDWLQAKSYTYSYSYSYEHDNNISAFGDTKTDGEYSKALRIPLNGPRTLTYVQRAAFGATNSVTVTVTCT